LANAGFDSGEVFDVVQGRFATRINLKRGWRNQGPPTKGSAKGLSSGTLPAAGYRGRDVWRAENDVKRKIKKPPSCHFSKGKLSSCDLLWFCEPISLSFCCSLPFPQKLGNKEARPQDGGLARSSWGPAKVVIPGDECPLLDKPRGATLFALARLFKRKQN